jgi:hypothetical protein
VQRRDRSYIIHKRRPARSGTRVEDGSGVLIEKPGCFVEEKHVTLHAGCA